MPSRPDERPRALRQAAPMLTPLAHWPGATGAAAFPSPGPAAPPAPAGDFSALVARALAILAEESASWEARRAADLPPRSIR